MEAVDALEEQLPRPAQVLGTPVARPAPGVADRHERGPAAGAAVQHAAVARARSRARSAARLRARASCATTLRRAWSRRRRSRSQPRRARSPPRPPGRRPRARPGSPGGGRTPARRPRPQPARPARPPRSRRPGAPSPLGHGASSRSHRTETSRRSRGRARARARCRRGLRAGPKASIVDTNHTRNNSCGCPAQTSRKRRNPTKAPRAPMPAPRSSTIRLIWNASPTRRTSPSRTGCSSGSRW